MSDNDNTLIKVDELKTQLLDSQESLQNLVFQKSMQQLEDLSQIKKTRKKNCKNKDFNSRGKFLIKL